MWPWGFMELTTLINLTVKKSYGEVLGGETRAVEEIAIVNLMTKETTNTRDRECCEDCHPNLAFKTGCAICPCHTKTDTWEEEFDVDFSASLAPLPLTKERVLEWQCERDWAIKHFIHTVVIPQARKERDGKILALLENMRDVYDDDVDSRNDKYRIEGFNKALKDISAKLSPNNK